MSGGSLDTNVSLSITVANAEDESVFNDNKDLTKSTSPRSPRYVKLQDDDFINAAGLQRTSNSGRKSSVERMLEEKLETSQPASQTKRDYYQQKQERFRSQSLEILDEPAVRDRKGSLYDRKNVPVPVLNKGNRISSRTKNLFEQYEKDITTHEKKPTFVRVGSIDLLEPVDMDDGEKSKAEIQREMKEMELREVKMAYQKRLLDDEKEMKERRQQEISQRQMKQTKSIGDVKNSYLSAAKNGLNKQDDEVDGDKSRVDNKGVAIEKSGGKVEVVRSADGVGNIMSKFKSLGASDYKKSNFTQEVGGEFSSARGRFNNADSPVADVDVKRGPVNRPVQKKVVDPMQLMEMRKKLTYGNEEEMPQDGIVKKTVVMDEREVGDRKQALDVYKHLETRHLYAGTSTQKPRTKLISDNDAQKRMSLKRSVSETSSETNDVSVDVSGYGSGAPTSPASTLSDACSSLSDPCAKEEILADDSLLAADVNSDISPIDPKVDMDPTLSHQYIEYV